MPLERKGSCAYCRPIQIINKGHATVMVSKTKVISSILASAALCVIIPGAANAQKVPVFHPGPWEVGSSQLASARGLRPMKLPCIISTEYDNGYTVRFSGGGGNLLAMAIDFRQEVFKQGRKYDAMVSVGDSYVKQVGATAFTPSTLIFNLRPLSDFYATLQKGKQLEISVDDNTMKFNLNDIAASYEGLEGCYNGGTVAPVKPMVSEASVDAKAAPAKVPAVEKVVAATLPRSFDEIVQNSEPAKAPPMKIAEPKPAPDAQPVVADAAAPAAAPAPRGPEGITPMPGKISRNNDPVPTAKIQTAATTYVVQTETVKSETVAAAPVAQKIMPTQWTARAGEDLKIVLSRWADRAGYDLDWQSAQDGKVAQDVSMSGSFEDAVSQLLAENSAATGISGRFDTAQGSKPVAGSAAAWNAKPGASLQSVLDQWGSKAGVAVVWQTSINAPVKTAINDNGNFEEAVGSLLDQYSGDSTRPVGRLNVDPQTGQKTLYMEMDRS